MKLNHKDYERVISALRWKAVELRQISTTQQEPTKKLELRDEADHYEKLAAKIALEER